MWFRFSARRHIADSTLPRYLNYNKLRKLIKLSLYFILLICYLFFLVVGFLVSFLISYSSNGSLFLCIFCCSVSFHLCPHLLKNYNELGSTYQKGVSVHREDGLRGARRQQLCGG